MRFYKVGKQPILGTGTPEAPIKHLGVQSAPGRQAGSPAEAPTAAFIISVVEEKAGDLATASHSSLSLFHQFTRGTRASYSQTSSKVTGRGRAPVSVSLGFQGQIGGSETANLPPPGRQTLPLPLHREKEREKSARVGIEKVFRPRGNTGVGGVFDKFWFFFLSGVLVPFFE